MSRLIVNGGNPLNGSIRANGAKNSILPILAATIINGGENIIHNCPDLKDVHSAIAILRHLGCRVEYSGGTIVVDSRRYGPVGYSRRPDAGDALFRHLPGADPGPLRQGAHDIPRRLRVGPPPH